MKWSHYFHVLRQSEEWINYLLLVYQWLPYQRPLLSYLKIGYFFPFSIIDVVPGNLVQAPLRAH